MAKYLFHGSYTRDGIKGVLKDGGTGRRKAVDALAESLGGTVESMYWALGKDDFYVIANLPDNAIRSGPRSHDRGRRERRDQHGRPADGRRRRCDGQAAPGVPGTRPLIGVSGAATSRRRASRSRRASCG